MTEQHFPLQAGDTATVAMVGPCVGGLIRIWTDTGPARLWSVHEAQGLSSIQGTGVVSRTLRESGRYREVGFLSTDSGTLILQQRFPVEGADGSLEIGAQVFTLGPPPKQPPESMFEDFRAALSQAVQHCVRSGEYLVVETGGWDSPDEPYCLFIVVDEGEGPMNIIETAPQPLASEVWAPHCVAGEAGASLRAPSTPETLDVVALIMIEAIQHWGLGPWDVGFTFGTR